MVTPKTDGYAKVRWSRPSPMSCYGTSSVTSLQSIQNQQQNMENGNSQFLETKTISQNISMLVYMKCFSFPFFFIRETTLISNPCLFNQNKDGNDCKGNFASKDFYKSNKN